MDVNPVQFIKAEKPIAVTAYVVPVIVTEDGIIIEPVQEVPLATNTVIFVADVIVYEIPLLSVKLYALE